MDNKTEFNWTEKNIEDLIWNAYGHSDVRFQMEQFKKDKLKEHKVEEKRIEVITLSYVGAGESNQYAFILNNMISEKRYPAIKSAIERELNNDTVVVPQWYTRSEIYDWLLSKNYSKEIAFELADYWFTDLQGAFKKGWEKAQYELNKKSDTVVEDKIDIDWSPKPVTEKYYTQSEVDAIRKEAFCSGFFKGWYNGCFEEDKAYSNKIGEARYEEWLSSLNPTTNEPLSDSKTISTVYFDKQVLNPHQTGTQAYTNWEQGFLEAANKYFKADSIPTLERQEVSPKYNYFNEANKLMTNPYEKYKQNTPQESKQDSKGWIIECLVVAEKRNYWIQPNGFYKHEAFGDDFTAEQIMSWNKFNYIHSVKRLSDGEVFSVNDIDSVWGKIIRFELVEGLYLNAVCDDGKPKPINVPFSDLKKLPLTEQPKPRQMWNKHTGIHDESVLCTGMKCQEYNPLNKEHKYI